jgi:hypothetical protein
MFLQDLDGTTYPLDKPAVSIGRSAENDIRLADLKVSSRHAVIRQEGGRFILEDLGSTNGTFVNGEQVAAPRLIGQGDRIQIGETVLVMKETEAEPAARAEAGFRDAPGAPAPAQSPAPVYPSYQAAAPPEQSDTLAIVGLVLGGASLLLALVGIVLTLLGGIGVVCLAISIVLGLPGIGLSGWRLMQGERSGLAIGGLVTSILGVLVSVCAVCAASALIAGFLASFSEMSSF